MTHIQTLKQLKSDSSDDADIPFWGDNTNFKMNNNTS